MSITSVINDTVTSVSVVNALKPLPPTITNYSVGGLDDTALDPAGGQTVQINGTGFLPGATITFDGSAVAVVTYVSPNRLTFTSPAKSAGTYTIYVVNSDGGTAIYIPGIIYSVLPTWTTGAGTLGSYYETQSISNTVVASGDAPITYSLYSGSLPTGASLAANGVITGTAPVDSSSTTYSFTIEAIDAQLQGSTRSFSLTINTDAVTWVSPANNTTYTSAANSAISTVTLSATDAAGYAVSYSANALPTGLSLSGANITGTPTVIADSSTLLTATAATTNRTATRTINWSITVANDPYFEYNTLLIPGASTTFVDDASTNNFAVSIFGDTKPNNFNPYTPGYYSNYFDGSGDYLTLPDNTAFDFPGDFTVEAWVYFNAVSGAQGVYTSIDNGADSWVGVSLTFSGTSFLATSYISGDDTITHQNTVAAGQWYHIAIVRSGSSTKSYLNGVQSTSTTSGTYSLTQSGGTIGSAYPGSSPLNGYISNLRVVKGTAVYTSSFTPSTAPLTAISGTSLLTCQSNRFIDNSTNNFTITVAGNTAVNSFDPFTPNTSYSTYGSGYFDGSGDYLTVPNNAGLQFGTGDFTVEYWVNFTTTPGGSSIIPLSCWSSDSGWELYYRSVGSTFAWYYNSSYLTGTTTPKPNTWYHLAVTRSSGTTRLFVNGAIEATLNSDTTNFTPSSILYIGNELGSVAPFTGYLTDVRVIKGTAVYTTAFTPPTSPLTAIANTSLLTLQNNQSVNNSVFLDNSTNNFLVTRNGNTTQGTFSPYGGNWSNYFDGTGDYLRIGPFTGQSDLIPSYVTAQNKSCTIDFWVYPTTTGEQRPYSYSTASVSSGTQVGLYCVLLGSSSSYQVQFGWYNDSSQYIIVGGSALPNTWTHIAFTYNPNGTGTLYVNGTSVGTVSGGHVNGGAPYVLTNAYTWIGAYPASSGMLYFNGYISNFRYVNNQILYTANFTPSTIPLTPVTNTSLLTCQSNRLIDNSINNYTITKNGDTSVQRFSPFNPSSVTPSSYSGYFDGTGDYLGVTSNSAFAFGTGAYSMEGWIYISAAPTYISTLFDAGGATNAISLGVAASGAVQIGKYGIGNVLISTAGDVPSNQWVHVAAVRVSTATNDTKLYVNGILKATGTDTNNWTVITSPTVGGIALAGYVTTGYISNLRVVKGVAVYTGAFTPPTSPLTATQSSGTNIAAITGTSTSLLTCQSTTFIDNSTNNFTITNNGNSQPSIQNPFGFTSATTNGYTPSTIGGSGRFANTTNTTANISATLTGANAMTTWTIEMFCYAETSSITDQVLLGPWNPNLIRVSSGTLQVYLAGNSVFSVSSALPTNQWNHLAICCDSTNLRLYVNGVRIATAANPNFSINMTDVVLGAQATNSTANDRWPGYISNFRVLNGTALYTAPTYTIPTAPLTAIANTKLLLGMTNAGIYDSAMINNLETVGDAKISTAVSKFGGSSMYFDGTGDYLSSLGNPYLVLGTGDFTIECWFNVNSTTNNGLLHLAATVFPASVTGVALYIASNNISMYCAGAASPPGGAISTGVWYHVAMVRYNGVTKLYLNGTYSSGAGSVTDTTNYTGSALAVGGYYNSTLLTNGYIDDLRITKGYARYTSNFTPPTSAFPTY